MGKLSIIFISFLAISTLMVGEAFPQTEITATIIKAICNRVSLLLESSNAIINTLLEYLLAQIDQLIYDSFDELLGGTVQIINSFLQNLFEAECYSSIVDHISVEIRNFIKNIFNSFACLLTEIINTLTCVIKILGKLIGRHSLLKEFKKLVDVTIQYALDDIKQITNDCSDNPRVTLLIKDAANDLAQCSNIVLRSVTTEIEYVNGLVDKSGGLVSKILQNLMQCLVLDITCVQSCLDDAVKDSKVTLAEMKSLITLDETKDFCEILLQTQTCAKSVVNNLVSNLEYTNSYKKNEEVQ